MCHHQPSHGIKQIPEYALRARVSIQEVQVVWGTRITEYVLRTITLGSVIRHEHSSIWCVARMTLAFSPHVLQRSRVGLRYTAIDQLNLFAVIVIAETLSVLHRCREDRIVARNTRGMRTMRHRGGK